MKSNRIKPFEFVPFQESDIAILTPVMKRAFDADAQFHLGHDGGPPGYDDGSFLRQWALHPKATAFRLNSGNQAAGAVILWIDRQTQVREPENTEIPFLNPFRRFLPKLFVTYFPNTRLAVSTKITRKGFKNEWYFVFSNALNMLGCIFLDPIFQHSGMGTAIWRKIETMYPETRE